MQLRLTDHGDDSGKLTVADDHGGQHRFSVRADHSSDAVLVDYEETLTPRGRIITTAPSDRLWRRVCRSDEVAAFADDHGCAEARPRRRAFDR